VHIRDQDQKVIEVREAPRGTAAIEFLKCLSGIKECYFAKVKYLNYNFTEVIDTD